MIEFFIEKTLIDQMYLYVSIYMSQVAQGCYVDW